MIRSILLGVVPALLVALLASRPLYATPAVTIDDVRAMQAKIPNCERGCTARGGYATAGDALLVAQAIAGAARSRHEAALEAVYAAFESVNRARIVSADGRDAGAWQLRDAGPDALVPALAVVRWQWIADASRARCGDLTGLVSGTCGLARAKTEARERIAEEIER